MAGRVSDGASAPTVSVVIPAYNVGRWIGLTIDSLSRQTFADFEIIVVDDGSSDDTREVLAAIADPRLRVFALPQNAGSAVARNRGIEAARGEFVAFMDGDDLALPDWLERQLGLLRSRPDVGLCGAWFGVIGARDGVWSTYAAHDDIKADLLFRCAMNQSTIVCRHALLRRHGLRYDPTFRLAQDYDMWTRCAEVMTLANTPAILAEYRIHTGNVSVLHPERSAAFARQIRARQLAKLGLTPTAAELELHHALGTYGPSGARAATFDVTALAAWLLRLRQANLASGYVSDQAMRLMLYEYWRRCCKAPDGPLSFPALRFLTAPIARGVPAARRVKDLVKIVLRQPLYSLPRSVQAGPGLDG